MPCSALCVRVFDGQEEGDKHKCDCVGTFVCVHGIKDAYPYGMSHFNVFSLIIRGACRKINAHFVKIKVSQQQIRSINGVYDYRRILKP